MRACVHFIVDGFVGDGHVIICRVHGMRMSIFPKKYLYFYLISSIQRSSLYSDLGACAYREWGRGGLLLVGCYPKFVSCVRKSKNKY